MATTYAAGEPIYGAGTQIRYVVLAAGVTARPTTGFKVLTGVTTSEISGNQDTKEIPGDYDSSGDGDWKDARPGKRGWGFALGANKKVDTPQANMLQELWDAWASGAYVWVERLLPQDTHWRGGLAYITDPKEPAPFDGVVTFSCGFAGKKALTKTAVTP